MLQPTERRKEGRKQKSQIQIKDMDIKIDFRQKIECLWNLLHSASSFYFNLCHAVIQSSSTFLRSILCQTLPFHTGGSFFHFKLETMGKTHQFLPLRVKLQINIKQILRICDFVFFCLFHIIQMATVGWLAGLNEKKAAADTKSKSSASESRNRNEICFQHF